MVKVTRSNFLLCETLMMFGYLIETKWPCLEDSSYFSGVSFFTVECEIRDCFISWGTLNMISSLVLVGEYVYMVCR